MSKSIFDIETEHGVFCHYVVVDDVGEYGYFHRAPIPPRSIKRIPANQKDCLIGVNRKMRKQFSCEQWSGYMLQRETYNPIWKKKLRREARHNRDARLLAEKCGLYHV